MALLGIKHQLPSLASHLNILYVCHTSEDCLYLIWCVFYSTSLLHYLLFCPLENVEYRRNMNWVSHVPHHHSKVNEWINEWPTAHISIKHKCTKEMQKCMLLPLWWDCSRWCRSCSLFPQLAVWWRLVDIRRHF